MLRSCELRGPLDDWELRRAPLGQSTRLHSRGWWQRELLSIIECHPYNLSILAEFVRRNCMGSSWANTEDEAIAIAAEELAFGTLVLVRIPNTYSPAWQDNPVAPVDPPPFEPVPPPPRPPAPEPDPASLTWLSFEVVDEEGVPAEGAFACSIDTAMHRGALAPSLQRFDEVPWGAWVNLRVTEVRFPRPGLRAGHAPEKPVSPPVHDHGGADGR